MQRLVIAILFVLLFIHTGELLGQTGSIKGRVYNSINNDAIPFANIIVDTLGTGTSSDIDGNYKISNLKPGSYNVICSFIGFEKAIFYEIIVRQNKSSIIDIPMIETSANIGEIFISTSKFNKTQESPLSLHTVSAEEIYRSPGSNRDISKVIQVLPGVASTASFRNDIIVRGGAPNENRFYLDGIEVPNINHFATQGSSGGPVGMINVNFIREVDFYSGAFPSNRGNALSSIIDFKQITGNNEKLTGTFLLGSSDMGITLDGPSGKNSSFVFSARRSYLQFLFKALNLPFLPTYNDFQYKHSFNINKKNKLTIIGLGAIDDFELNKSANDGITDSATINRNNYILGNIPTNSQWNYAIGTKWTHFAEHSFITIVASKNYLNNEAIKYQNNIETAANLNLDYNSQEIENKFRIENTKRKNDWKWNFGAGYENILYKNSTYNKITVNSQVQTIDFTSKLRFNKYSVFTQLSKSVFKQRLALSFALRTDINDYSNDMSNPLDQLSPGLSGSYTINEKWNANFNTAIYHQLPAYTVLGYRDNNDNLINKENNLKYIQVKHLVSGLEYSPTSFSKITVEGFYKIYDDYPFLLNDSISLANLGGDFGIIGNEPASSTSKGRSYGAELFLQQKLSSKVYGLLSYTLVRSEFKDKSGSYTPSAWDNKHLLNITAGKKLKNNWEVGLKFRLLGGTPFTPYDLELTTQKEVWDATGQGVFDWDKLNTERNPTSHGLDIRLDKKWYYKKWALNTYLDIQNIYNFESKGQPYISVVRDVDGNPVEDPNNSNAYKTFLIENTNGTILPSLGIMIEF